MNHAWEIIRGTIILVVCLSVIVWFLWRWLKGSRDPATLVMRWVLTVLALAGIAATAAFIEKGMKAGDPGAILGAFAAAALGVFVAVIWTPAITDFFGRAVGSLFDGGTVEIEPRPYYSTFLARRAKGNYFEALTELRSQLDKFPTDFEGLMYLAELQAENLDDLPGAELTIQRFCDQPNHAPANIAYALNRLADWHLNRLKDRDAAHAALQKIIDLLPNTEMSLQAAQRIARLADTAAMLAASEDRPRHVVKKGIHNLGLVVNPEKFEPAETEPSQAAAQYVKHLEEHPLDSEAREKLAALYATHFHRLDLALEQLEQLVAIPGAPDKQVVHWLNLMADLQVQENALPDAVRATLQRIVELFPDLAAADNAQRRMSALNLEFKGKNKGGVIRLGVYEQNIGLKGRS